MKKKQLIVLGIAILTVSLSGCGNKQGDETIGTLEATMSTEDIESSIEEDSSNAESESESSETETQETITIPETTREASEVLPDAAIYDDTVLENYVLEINNAERYTVNYPEGYEIEPKDKYKTYLVQDNTQIFFYCINDTFEDSNSVFHSTQIDDALYRFPYTIDGKDYTASVIDRGKVSQIDVNGKTVSREIPSIEFASNDISSFVKPVCISYFTTFNDRGFALIGVSTDKTEEELEIVMHDMVATLGTYTPAKTEAQYEFAENTYVANDKTGITFPYPEGWEVQKTEDGLVVISAPKDGSLYDGAKIIYKSDESHEFLDDYAQFAGISDLIAPIYMQSGYQKDYLKTEFLVTSMDDSCTLDGIKCILFEIEDRLLPMNKATELLLPSTGDTIYSFRYTFNSNGIPAMVSFQYTKNNKYQVRDMADNIMSKITLK